MRLRLPNSLFPPQTSVYEQTQKAKLLHVMLVAILLGALASSISNFTHGWIPEAISLLLLGGVCLIGLYLNRKLRFRPAAILLTASFLIEIYFILYKGISLFDAGVIAYPIYILCVTFLFGRKGLLFATLFSILSIAVIYLMEIYGFIDPRFPATLNRVVILSVILAAYAMITLVVWDTWETNLIRLRESYDLTLQGWAKALEYRDGETEGHSQRVIQVCLELARKLGIDENEILHIQRGALLHDIGKMAMPDRILFKPGPLDDEEWAIMKQHPVLASRMISHIPSLQPALSIPHSHHERWDGMGYPEGLKGMEIPLAARIFAIVDQWDALNSDRPYRKAWPREEIIPYLRENAGKIYDPRVVKAFLEIISY